METKIVEITQILAAMFILALFAGTFEIVVNMARRISRKFKVRRLK